jgi:hypothetical protein
MGSLDEMALSGQCKILWFLEMAEKSRNVKTRKKKRE